MNLGPGIYPDISAEDYHADCCKLPSLTNSLAKRLDVSPQHAWTDHPKLNPAFERKEDTKFNIGNAAHALWLGDPRRFAIVHADNWTTKAAKELKQQAYEEHRIPILEAQFQRAVDMRDAGLLQLRAHMDAADAFTDGLPEVTLVWEEDVPLLGKVLCRCRLDWKPNKSPIFDDFKSTEVEGPDSWSRTAFQCGFDFQSAFYMRGIKALGLCSRPRFRFIVQETSPPYALFAAEFREDAIELATRRVERAIKQWAWCQRNGMWPGYLAKTHYIEAPSWHETQQMEREERRAEMSKEMGADLLTLGVQFHKPL